MRIATTFLAVVLVVGCGGKKDENKNTPGSGSSMAGSGSSMAGSSMAGSGSSMAGSNAGSGSAAQGSGSAAGSGSGMAAGSGSGAGSGSAADDGMAHHAGMCPSTVFGTTTKAELKGKTVVVTVTNDDKEGIASIQKRADELLKERADNVKPGSTSNTHDQKGTFGGSKGMCPIYIPEGGKADSKKDPKGVVVTITPKDKPDDLKKQIDDRITKTDEWVKKNLTAGDKGTHGGVGGGKGNDGSNRSGQGDGKGQERKGGGDGKGGGNGTGGGGGKGTGGGNGKGSGSAK